MKIGVVIGKFPSLNETFVLDHITSLIDRGYDVDIHATSPKEVPTTHEDIYSYSLLNRTIHREDRQFALPQNKTLRILKGTSLLAKGLLRNPKAALNSVNLFRSQGVGCSLGDLYKAAPFTTSRSAYDVIHCHFPENGELAVSLRDLGAIQGKIVTSFHGYNLPEFSNGRMWHLYRNLAEKGDLFLFCSEHMKRWYDDQGWGGRRTMVHRYAVRLELFQPQKQRRNNDGRARVLSIGRLVEKKGFQYGIAGVASVLKRFPHLSYEIIGDGSQRPMLERLIADLGVAENVSLLGWKNRDEILQLYQQADIFLAPSVTSADGDQEGIPLVLHEAMASGLPTISTRHTGIPELVEHGETGFLVSEKDPEGIARMLTHLLEHSEIARQMGDRGRKRIEESNDIQRQTDRLIKIYESL